MAADVSTAYECIVIYILSVGRTEAWACHSPPVLLYPTGPGSLVSRQPSHWQSSCQICREGGGDQIKHKTTFYNGTKMLIKVSMLSSYRTEPRHISQLFTRGVCVCYLHCGDVLSGEGIGSVADEQACFTHSPEIRKEKRGGKIWQRKNNNQSAAWFILTVVLITVYSSVNHSNNNNIL